MTQKDPSYILLGPSLLMACLVAHSGDLHSDPEKGVEWCARRFSMKNFGRTLKTEYKKIVRINTDVKSVIGK